MILLKFIFSSFWIFCGFIILIYALSTVITSVLGIIVAAFKGSDIHISAFSGNEIIKKDDEVSHD